MFAGSCIGVICLVLCLEFLRRIGREYDAFITRRARLTRQYLSAESPSSTSSAAIQNIPSSSQQGNIDTATPSSSQKIPDIETNTTTAAATTAFRSTSPLSPPPPPPPFQQQQFLIRPTFFEQLVRAVLHLLQFAVAYFIMLLAMYFNGYIIICIFIGAFLGAFIFSWEPLGPGSE